MSKPIPAHHRVIDIPRAKIADGYDVTIETSSGRLLWQIVAAASTQLQEGEKPPAENYIRVIVAPARGPK